MGIETFIFCGQGELFPFLTMKEFPADMPIDSEQVEGLKALLNDYLAIVRKAGKEYAIGEIMQETHAELEKPILSQEMYEQQ